MDVVGLLHGRVVHTRRVEVLARHLSHLMPPGASVVDVGCGDGRVAAAIDRLRPDVEISGIEVMQRPEALVPVTVFDGVTMPFPDDSVDIVLFVDVLHHTPDPMVLLREAKRVARQGIVIKDHTRDGLLADTTLRFMDWIGNARHGVALPYNYWSSERWDRAISELGLQREVWNRNLGLYPRGARWLFERSLHFVAVLK